MAADWEVLAFELAPWKETGTYVLKGGPVDEAQACGLLLAMMHIFINLPGLTPYKTAVLTL